MRAGVKDVAKRAGVSVGTVSNVLNRPDAVADATRERVEAAMRELDFVRNASARQLRAGQSTAVGAVLLDLSNPFYTALARGIEDRLALDNLTLMVASSDEDPEREERVLQLFAEQGIRGLVITPTKTTKKRLERLDAFGIPSVLLDSQSKRHASVGMDNVSGGRQVVRHLLERGHRRIACLGGPEHLEQSRDRLAGAVQAVVEAGLNPDEVIVSRWLPGMSADDGQRAFIDVYDGEAAKPTAFFCINDIVALGVQRECRLRGYDMPSSVAVVGYDDVPFASELMTPLTSVRQPTHEIGYAAADLLLSGAGRDVHQVFRPELVIRASSGGPA